MYLAKAEESSQHHRAWRPIEAVKERTGYTDAGGKHCTMYATCINSEGRKPEVSLTFKGRRRGGVACAPRDVTSGV